MTGAIQRAVFVVGLVASLASGPVAAQDDPDGTPAGPPRGVDVDQLAPDFNLTDLEGRSHRLEDRRGSKAVLLVFWATWCAPCLEEIPRLKTPYTQGWTLNSLGHGYVLSGLPGSAVALFRRAIEIVEGE